MNFIRDTYGFSTLLPHSGWPQRPAEGVKACAFDAASAPTPAEAALFASWLTDSQKQSRVQQAALQHLFDHRHEHDFWFDTEDENVLESIDEPHDFLQHLTLRTIVLHGVSDDGRPYFGLSFDCRWDDEHGAGVMMLGDECLQWGGADTACLQWVARRQSTEYGFHPLP